MAMGNERVFSKKVALSRVQRIEGWETALQCREAAMVVRRNEMWTMFSRSPEDRQPLVDGEGGSSPGAGKAEPGPWCWCAGKNSLEAPPQTR